MEISLLNNSFYLCSITVAKTHCNGCMYQRVHYCNIQSIANHEDFIRNGWTSDNGIILGEWTDVVLLKNIGDIQTVLALADPLFLKVSITSMSPNLRRNIAQPWEIL